VVVIDLVVLVSAAGVVVGGACVLVAAARPVVVSPSLLAERPAVYLLASAIDVKLQEQMQPVSYQGQRTSDPGARQMWPI
jgi:hypothetical protein